MLFCLMTDVSSFSQTWTASHNDHKTNAVALLSALEELDHVGPLWTLGSCRS